MKVTTLNQFENGMERIADKMKHYATKSALDGKLDVTGKAETAGTADNAIRDGEGNVISSTYLKKSDNVSVDLSDYLTKTEASDTYLEKSVWQSAGISTVNLPSQSGTITYDGTAKTPTWLNYDPLKLQISGDYQNKTNAGTYQTGFKPISPYTWSNGNQNIQNTSWTIGKAVGSLSLSAESGAVNIDATKTFTVNRAGDGVITVTSSNSNIATASVNGNTVTITGKAVGSATITVKVAEGTNHFAPADKTFAVTVTKIPLNLSASISSAVTYNLTGTITLNGNAGGGAVTATSANSSCVAVSSTTTGTVTVKCTNYSAAATSITINVAETTKYSSGTCTCNVTTAKATPTLTLSAESVNLTAVAPTATVTVTTNSTGTISVNSSDVSICTATVNKKNVTISAVTRGTSNITVTVDESNNFLTVSKKLPVDINHWAINMLEGRTLKQLQTLIKNGHAPSLFQKGDYFDITFPSQIDLDNGYSIPANSTWRVVCIGIDHNSDIEGYNRLHFAICKSTDNVYTAFYFKNLDNVENARRGWKDTTMREWLNNTFYNALPTDLKNVISPCTKFTDNTGQGASDVSVTPLSDKIWLLSEAEVVSGTVYANPYEAAKQEQYEFFKNGNMFSSGVYNQTGEPSSGVWTRSLTYDNTDVYCCRIYFNGRGGVDWIGPMNDICVMPCFTIA